MKIYHYLRKRGLALFLALTMCLSLMPAQAMAETLESQWEALSVEEIQSLLTPEQTAFTAGDLLDQALGERGKLVRLGVGTAEGVVPADPTEEFQIFDGGFVRLVEIYEDDSLDDSSTLDETDPLEEDYESDPDGEENDHDESGVLDEDDHLDESNDLDEDGIFNEDDTFGEEDRFDGADSFETENIESEAEETFFAAAPEFVELYGVFERENVPVTDSETDSDFSTDGDISVSSVTVKLANGAETPLENNGAIPFSLSGNPAAHGRIEIAVTVIPGEEKTFHITVPYGIKITNYATEEHAAYAENLKSSEFRKADPESGYSSANTGTLTYTCTDNCKRGVVRFNVEFDRYIWNGLTGITIPDALKITSDTGVELFSADAEIHYYASSGEETNWGFWVDWNSWSLSSKSEKDFKWTLSYANADAYITSLVYTTDYPQIKEAGSTEYTYAEPSRVSSFCGSDYKIDSDTHKLTISRQNVTCSRGGNVCVYFQWPHDLKLSGSKNSRPSRKLCKPPK